MKTIGIILARKGSKGLKNKNRLKINGKSLVEITINSAKKSKFLDDIIFSSNDDYLINLAKRKKILVPFKRPEHLCRDNSKTYDVIKHAVKWYENNIDLVSNIVILQPTTPFRTDKHIDLCIKKLARNTEANSIITVKKIDYPIEWSLRKEKKYLKFENSRGKKIFKRQDAKKLFKPSGLVYIIKKNYFLKMKSILPGAKCLFLDTREDDSINIDNRQQFMFATFLSKKNK